MRTPTLDGATDAAPDVTDPAPAAPPPSARWGSLDVLRGVALYAMVVHHLLEWTGGDARERLPGFPGIAVTDLAAPIFAVGVGAAALLVGSRIAAWGDRGRQRARTALWRWTQVLLAGLVIDVAVGGGIDGGGVLPSLAVLGVLVTALSAAGVRRPAAWWGIAVGCALLVRPALDVAGDGVFDRFANGPFSLAVYGVFAAAGAAVAAHASATTGGEERLPLLRAVMGVLVFGAVGSWAAPHLLAPDGLWPPSRSPGFLPFTMWGLVASFALWAALRRWVGADATLGRAIARAGRRTLLLFMGHYVIKLALQHSDLLGTLDGWRWELAAWAAAVAVCVVASLPKPSERAARQRPDHPAHAG